MGTISISLEHSYLQLFWRPSPTDFERQYLALFKDDATIRPHEEFLVLDKLFASVDAFCSDPELCDEDDLSEDQLRQESRDALRQLKLKNLG